MRSTAIAGALVLTTSGALVLLDQPIASATPVIRQVRIPNTDWTSAGVGGIGSKSGGGKATIKLAGVKGKVTGAWLSWHGIGPENSSGYYTGSYDNPSIKVNGKTVTGVSQGESGSNCWGSTATSRTYLAAVTKIVKAKGNGKYQLTGLGDHGDVNGASLVVTYRDKKRSNNQDLYLYYGNDTDAAGYPGEDYYWADTVDNVAYEGGPVALQLAVADGQQFGTSDDAPLTVTGNAGTISFDDTVTNHGLWDGTTVHDMGHSRADGTSGPGSLYDLETFDVTGAFDGATNQGIDIATALTNDCHSLTMAALSVEATGHQPPVPRTVSLLPGTVKEGTRPAKCHKKPCPKYTQLRFTAQLSRASSKPVKVKISTLDGTAVAPGDYLKRTATVTIPKHHKSAKFSVRVVRDKVFEDSEFFYAQIVSASVPVATGVATGTIVNDDKARRAQQAQVAPQEHAGGDGSIR